MDSWTEAWNWIRSDPDTYRDYDHYCFAPSTKTAPRREVAMKEVTEIPTEPGSYKTRCPCHEDSEASLSVLITEEGRMIVNCFAGCDWWDVKAAL